MYGEYIANMKSRQISFISDIPHSQIGMRRIENVPDIRQHEMQNVIDYSISSSLEPLDLLVGRRQEKSVFLLVAYDYDHQFVKCRRRKVLWKWSALKDWFFEKKKTV